MDPFLAYIAADYNPANSKPLREFRAKPDVTIHDREDMCRKNPKIVVYKKNLSEVNHGHLGEVPIS